MKDTKVSYQRRLALSGITIEIKQLLLLAFPLMLSEVVNASYNFTATLLAAHLGTDDLAAAGLVTTIFITIMVFMWGILIALSNLIAQYHGANDDQAISRLLKDGMWLACLFSIPGMLLVYNMAPVLLFFGQPAKTIAIATNYLHALSFAVFPDFWAVVLLQFVIGLGRTKLVLFFNLVKVPVTLIISFIFMYGKFGMPRLGIAGLGWGITAGMWLASILLLVYIFTQKDLRKYFFISSVIPNPVVIPSEARNLASSKNKHYFWEILKTGLPIAGMFCIEVGFFTVMSLIMGRIDSDVLAANQVVTQFTGFFIVVIAFAYSQAVSIRLGKALGQQDLSTVGSSTKAGIIIVTTIMLLVACCYWFIPQLLISLDLDLQDPKNKIIIYYVKQFLLVAGFVQLFEGIRIVLFGALRGLGETHFSMITSLITFWLISFPLGLLLTFVLKLGGVGMWLGFGVGAMVGVMLLFHRLKKISH